MRNSIVMEYINVVVDDAGSFHFSGDEDELTFVPIFSQQDEPKEKEVEKPQNKETEEPKTRAQEVVVPDSDSENESSIYRLNLKPSATSTPNHPLSQSK